MIARTGWKLVLAGVVVCGVSVAYGQPPPYIKSLTGFEQSEIPGGGYWAGDEVLFQEPTLSGTTRRYDQSDPEIEPDGIYGYNPPEEVPWSSSHVVDYAHHATGTQSYEITFNWGNPADTNAWPDPPDTGTNDVVRCTTVLVDNLEEPSVHLGGRIKFWIAALAYGKDDFVLYQDEIEASILMVVGIRESGSDLPQGTPETAGGDLEWVYPDGALADGIVPPDTNGVLPLPVHPGGLRIHTSLDPDAMNWTQVVINLGDPEAVRGFANNGTAPATAGDGVLDATGVGDGVNRGSLENITFTNDPTDTAGKVFYIYIDDVVLESDVPDPAQPPSIDGPVYDTDTQVLVNCTSETEGGEEAELFINDSSVGTAEIVGTVATFGPFGSGQPLGELSVGDVLKAKQTVYGDTSNFSAPIVVTTEGTALAENFDAYASQAEMEALWGQSDPADERKLLLTTGSASSCENLVICDHETGVTVSRLYRDIGTVNGTDERPLLVTYRYKHDTNNTNARDRFELTWSLDRVYGALGFAFTNGVGGQWTTQYTSMTNSPTALVIDGYESDYFYYDYALTGVERVPGVWHKMQIEVKTDVVNFYIDDQLANPVTTNGEPIWPDGVPRLYPDDFRYVILGNGYSNNGPATMFDDISVTIGTNGVPGAPTFGDPNPVDSPTVSGSYLPGDTQVEVIDIDSNAVEVAVYVNGENPVTSNGPFLDNTATLTVPALDDGDEITATQTLEVGVRAEVESCLSAPVLVYVPTPTVQGPLVPGMPSVSVGDIEENRADSVQVYKDLGGGDYTLIGTTNSPTTDPASVDVTGVLPSGLEDGTTIVATQTIAGAEGPYSAGVVVNLPPPSLAEPIVPLTTMVTVYDVLALPGGTASKVSVYVNDLWRADAAGGDTTIYVDTGTLNDGDIVTATQTVNGLESEPSDPVTVEFSEPPLTTNWIQTSTLPWGLTDHQAVYLNGYVYAVGGRSNESDADTYATDSVYYAAVNTNGSLGPWQATTDLPQAVAAGGAAALNDRIYVWGGWTTWYPTINTCYYADQNVDGTLGAWTTSTVTIPDSDEATPEVQMDSFGRGMLNYGDVLYIINGESNTPTLQTECYYSKLTGGGDYGPWIETTNTENASWFHGTAIVEGTTDTFLYRVAGNYWQTAEHDVYRTTINSDGSLGTWVRDDADTPDDLYEHACAVVNNKYIFMVGGLSWYMAVKDTVYYTTVDPDTGAVSGWRTGNPYPETVCRLAAVSYKAGGRDYLLVVSGSPSYYQGPLRSPNCWYTEVAVDTDGDTVPDYRDNCPYLFNTAQADADADGFGDACDVCDNSPSGHQFAPDGSLRADFEPDCDVDLADFAEFQVCFDPTATATEECAAAFDLNDDTKVNLDDFPEFVAALAGP